MIKLFPISCIREWDNYTIREFGMTSIDLMEQAAESFLHSFQHLQIDKKEIAVFCGSGNNGGDGLAISRMLINKGYKVSVYLVLNKSKSKDFEENLKRIKKYTSPQYITSITDFPFLETTTCIIDALLGIGLSQPLEGIHAQVVQKINESKKTCVSVDVPSGLFIDKYTPDDDIKISAHYTLSFEIPKISFFWKENESYLGEVQVIHIGLSKAYYRDTPTHYYSTTKRGISALIKHHSHFSHKGTLGHGLLIAGSYGKIGAAILSGQGAIHSGIGLLTLHVPRSAFEIVQNKIPEALCDVDIDERKISEIHLQKNHQAIGIGPGIGVDKKTVLALQSLLTQKPKSTPIVIDADGLNMISNHSFLLSHLSNAILTPHPKEFDTLFGTSQTHEQRIEKQMYFTKKHRVFIILKGRNTTITTPNGDLFFNTTGNRGMATGGMGDVLTGILLSLLAQGYSLQDACLVGVYVHGLAGDLSCKQHSFEATTPSVLIKKIGKAFLKLRN